MNREYHVIQSRLLGHPLELLVFGKTGKPILVFPSSCGRFFDYENFGMIHEISRFIEKGKVQVYCVDGIDRESWYSDRPPADRAGRANDYDSAVIREVLPFIRSRAAGGAGILTHGCSFGAYHALNFFLRHPDAFDSCIGLSGNYSIQFAVDGRCEGDVFFHDPLKYLPGLTDPWYLEKLRENLLILCCGQGAWEEWRGEAAEVSRLLREKKVPHWFDVWGHDAAHDWPWWKRQIVYFLDRLDRAGLLAREKRLDREAVKAFLSQ